MTLSPVVKNMLIISLKNAVNAVLTNSALMAMLPGVFNFHNAAGVWSIAKLTGSVIAAREAMVWGPKILKWSMTGATLPNGE